MSYEPSKSKTGASAKSSARLAAATSDTKSGMPTKSGSEQAFQECDAIEAELAALKVTYEQYFLGMERVPPTRQYEDLKKRVERLKSSFVRNTAAKFRVQSIHGKFVTYERLWQRTLLEIENGTYKRDLVKAKRRVEKQKKPDANRSRSQEVVELPDEDFDVEEVSGSVPFRGVPSVAPLVPSVAPLVPSVAPLVPSVAPVTPPRGTGVPSIPSVAPLVPSVAPVVPRVAPVTPAIPPVAPVAARPPAAPRPAAPRPASASGPTQLSDDNLKSVYNAYVAAKRRNNEDTSKMSYDSIAASLRKQVPELMKQHGAKSVEFKVVIKDGKAVLKAVPK
ncbi:hypothetical protein JQX13_18255 [Archangium violaceum]|uniref:MXAN_5187 C-terminal domain-containing protein n=1 Tax=Archangium violaceum TaxID=83451 RepID=UPI00193B2FC4|nr:MXAN_5187 C-terminal domain-containing protein [Archangium violaceum]QRK11827.1 hypothetical protein JQX13_18255 [Archangium violaceum]